MTTKIKNGGAGDLPLVEVRVPNDELENFIRTYGVVACCEWFGHAHDSQFTADTIRELEARGQQ